MQKQELVDATNALKRECPGLNAVQKEDGRIRVDNIDLIGDQISATDEAIAGVTRRMQALVTETATHKEAVDTQIKNYSKLLDEVPHTS